MWDNPRLLNLAAGALTGLAALLFAFGALQLLLRSPLFPLREIVVRGELRHASREEIAGALEGIGGNFFGADLAAVRARLEQVGWVRRVDARRVWPDRIEVRLEEHVAFARWGDSGFVNSFGEPFAAPLDAAEQAALPLFAGPPGTEGELARRYRRFTELLAPLGEKPERVVLTPRYAWELRLATGLQLELGRDGPEPVEERLERFVGAFPATLGELGRAHYERADLRYPNGFALRMTGWKG
ncbi:MAG TPA: cell division protein FtsQ/DivIB [Burkholderiales bacterium]|nr:cell division protein FtsQ/DivIB [Burkholderiales bacterium]